MQENSLLCYAAFISYRHKELDTAVAKAVHRQIETYRIPAQIRKRLGRKNIGKVFRDQDELPLMADLGEGIRSALDRSEWLIVICSPDLLQSKWCLAEIDYFISIGRQDKIMTVLASGEPEESFPRQLCFLGDEECEPLAADVRAKDTVSSVRRVRNEKLRLLAPMLGVAYDDLRRRRRERIIRSVVALSAAVTVAAVGSSAYVLRQNALLEEQRNKALQNEAWALQERSDALISQSKFLSGISGEILQGGDVGTAALLALEALPANLDEPDRPIVSEAVTALRNSVTSLIKEDYRLTGGVTAVNANWEYLEQDSMLMCYDLDKLWMYDLQSGKRLFDMPFLQPGTFSYCPERSLIAFQNQSGPVIILDLITFTAREIEKELRTTSVMFVPGGKHILIANFATDSTFFELLETDTGRSVYRKEIGELVEMPEDNMFALPYIMDAAISPDGKSLVYSIARAPKGAETLVMTDLLSGEKLFAVKTEFPTVDKLRFSPDGKFLCTRGGANSSMEVFFAQTGERKYLFDPADVADTIKSGEALISPDSKFLAVHTSDDRGFVYSLEDGSLVMEMTPSLGPVVYLAFTGDSTLVMRRGITSPDIQLIPLESASLPYTVSIEGLYGVDLLSGGETHIYSKNIQFGENSFVCISSGSVYQLWEKRGDEMLGRVNSDRDIAKAFSPDGTRFVLSQEAVVKVYDAMTCEQLLTIPCDEFLICQLDYSPDGTRIFGADYRSNAWLWGAETGEVIYHWKSGYTASPFKPVAIFAPDWSCFALSNPGHIGGVYDLSTGERNFVFDPDCSMELTGSAVFAPDGKHIIVTLSREIKDSPESEGKYRQAAVALDVKTGEQTDSYENFKLASGQLLSPDRTSMLLVDNRTGELVMVNTQTQTLLWRVEDGGSEITWSQDSRYVAVSGSMKTNVYSVMNGSLKGSFAGDMPAFSPDGRYICCRTQQAARIDNPLVGGYDGAIYDLETGILFAKLHRAGIFNRSSNSVLTQDSLWRFLSPAQLVEAARERLDGRTLTDQERETFFLN